MPSPLERRDNPYVYARIHYPANTEYFFEAADGQAPENILYARYVTKVQDSLRAVEEQVQYTAASPNATGSLLYIQSALTTLLADQAEPGLLYPVSLSVDPSIASRFFGGNPFARNYALFAWCRAYRLANGQTTPYYTRSAVNVGQETGNLTCTINVVQPSRWRRGDTLLTQLMIARP